VSHEPYDEPQDVGSFSFTPVLTGCSNIERLARRSPGDAIDIDEKFHDPAESLVRTQAL
jgi:hypothetical protein